MTKQTTPTLDLATQLKEFLESLRVGGGDTGEYALAAQRYRQFEVESRRAAEPFSAGSEMRLKHLEAAQRSARKARACELVYEGAAIPAAVAAVASGAVEVEAAAPAATEPAKGAKAKTSKKARAADGDAGAYWKELESAVLGCATEAELNLLVHERKLGKKEFAEHKERLGGVGQYWTNLQVVIGNQREGLRASDLKTIEGEIAGGATERFYRVCQAMNEYHGLIGQERERAAGGWTVLLELPDGGDWIEEQFDRTILVPATRGEFERQTAAAGAFKTEAQQPAPAEVKRPNIAPPMAKTNIPEHRWRGATWVKENECVVCARDKGAVVHKVEPKQKRLAAGLPANTAGDWYGYALAHADYAGNGLKNRDEGKKLTDARRRDWQKRLDAATKELRLSWTLYNMARAVEAGTLPKALHGLTNDLQVRDAINLVLLGRTAGDEAAALAPYVQEVEPFTVEGELAKQGGLPNAATGGTLKLQEATPEEAAAHLAVEPPADNRVRVRRFPGQRVVIVPQSRCDGGYFKGTVRGDIADAYSADTIMTGGRLRRPFEFEGRLWMNSGGNSNSPWTCWPLYTREEWSAVALKPERDPLHDSYGDREYNYGGQVYVAGYPSVIFIGDAVAADEGFDVPADAERSDEPGAPGRPNPEGKSFRVLIDSPKRLKGCVGVCLRGDDVGVVLDITDAKGKREERVYPYSAVEEVQEPVGYYRKELEPQALAFQCVITNPESGKRDKKVWLCEEHEKQMAHYEPERVLRMPPRTAAECEVCIARTEAETDTDPSADPRKCESCELVYDTNNPAEAEMHDHADDEPTLKGEAIVRQLVKCETAEALALAISRYRLDDLEGVAGLTSTDREQITYAIETRQARIAEKARLPRYLKLDPQGDTRPTSKVGKLVGNDCGLLVVELPTGETRKFHEAQVKGDATAEDFEALKPARPTQPAPVKGVGPENRCPECAYKLPMHDLTCRTGLREQEAA